MEKIIINYQNQEIINKKNNKKEVSPKRKMSIRLEIYSN